MQAWNESFEDPKGEFIASVNRICEASGFEWRMKGKSSKNADHVSLEVAYIERQDYGTRFTFSAYLQDESEAALWLKISQFNTVVSSLPRVSALIKVAEITSSSTIVWNEEDSKFAVSIDGSYKMKNTTSHNVSGLLI